jgi:GNAT superfamily N-acetyltransferase
VSESTNAVVIAVELFDSEAARWVVARAEAELEVRYEFIDESEFGLTAAEFDPPAGAFLLARPRDGAPPIGGVGLRRIAGEVGEVGEVKRLWVHEDWRGRGVGRALMDELETAARGLGVTHLRLETGDRQPEAVALYADAGWYREEESWEGGPIRCGSIHFSKLLS